MAGLPVILRVAGRRVVVVGGGPVAARRARSLVEAGADVTVIAPALIDGFDQLTVKVEQGAYQTGDLDDAFLVVVATNDAQVNDRVAADARAMGVLVNRADDQEQGDFVVPAYRRRGPITVAVATDGISAAAARTLADQCAAAVGDDWPVLLETAAPWRAAIQGRVADDATRQAMLRRLTDEQAMNIYRDGGVDALTAYYQSMMDSTDTEGLTHAR